VGGDLFYFTRPSCPGGYGTGRGGFIGSRKDWAQEVTNFNFYEELRGVTLWFEERGGGAR